MRRAVLDSARAGSIHSIIVWIDMLPSDDADAAASAMASFADAPVAQFHDPGRFAGAALARDAFAGWREKLLAAPWLEGEMRELVESSTGDEPMWDAYLFFAPGARWDDRAPRPARWIRQTRWLDDGASVLLVDREDAPPVVADLVDTLDAMAAEFVRDVAGGE